MATLIPQIPKDCPYGERVTYERLGRDLDPGWIVMHSLGLHGHKTKIWGEGDIVVLSTLGFFCLEVKGGRVSCKDGVWHYSGGGSSYTKREDPWTQAQGTMQAVKKVLEQHDPNLCDVLHGFGVVMPLETFTTPGAEFEPAVLLDQRGFDRSLQHYIKDLSSHWMEAYRIKHNRSPRLPTRADIKRARELLRPDIESALSLGSHLTGLERKLLQLSNDQIRAARRMQANPRTIVRGKAGTGKTIIALDRAKQLGRQGMRVLYLCFNQLLAEHIRLSLKDDADAKNVEIWHVHALYRDVIKRAGLLEKLERPEVGEETLFTQVYPRVFIDSVLQTDARTWDALVVDEAQDILTPDHLDAFDLMLAEGLNGGRWHIFLDPLQNIYGTKFHEQVEARFKEAQPAYDDLFENCRNTRQVAVQASITSGIDLALDGAPDGPECGHVFFKDLKSFKAEITALVGELTKGGVRPQDIAILSTRRRENSLLNEVTHINGIPVVAVADAGKGQIGYSTMHAFKGLERNVVIAIDMDEIGSPNHSMLHYAGLSRARTLLRAFVPAACRPAYVRLAEDFAKRQVTAS